MNIAPLTQNNFSKALELLKKNNLPTEDITELTNLFIIAENNDVIATIGIEFYKQHALLRSLAVEEAYRKKGIAQELINYIEDYAQRNGAEDLVLLTTSAEKYFQKRFYETIDRNSVPEEIKNSAEFSSVCPSSAVVMKKNL